MGWGYDFWVGNFYQHGLAPGDYLKEYCKHFRTVEVDSTFYSIPHHEMVENWRAQAPSGFIFSAKFPQSITQDRMLSNVEAETNVFLERICLLGEKLGPLVIQLSYDFGIEEMHLLKQFLETLPQGNRYVVEVRKRNLLGDRLYSLLSDAGAALAMVDHPYAPKTDKVTADFVYIRLEGDRKKVKGTLGKVEVDRGGELKAWAETIRGFLGRSLEVYVYCSKFYSGHSPTDALRLSELLREKDDGSKN
jgi:uncharacterized protein YecE (DUF72 family)